MWDISAAALGRYEVDGSGDSDPGTCVWLLFMLGATIAPKADVDEVDCVGSTVSSEPPLPADDDDRGAPSSCVVIGTVRVDCCIGLVGELTGVGPMIISEVSISRLPPPELAPLPPAGGDSDDAPVSDFCWFTEVRCLRSLLSFRWWWESTGCEWSSSPVRSITWVSETLPAWCGWCLWLRSSSASSSPSDILTMSITLSVSALRELIFFSSKGGSGGSKGKST